MTAITFSSYSKCRARNEKENLSEILKKTHLGTLPRYCFISGLHSSEQLGSGEDAADAFNTGNVRFLVSTEAGGEGIDLQERCATLIHVDMPWNPMRLHQRVGRLSRYGQRRPVAAYILRNPETVESRLWDLLLAKLERVQRAISPVMEDQEDISQLVIGMAGNAMFNDLFSTAQSVPKEGLGAWFDRKTATLGGQDVVQAVRDLLGNVARFDFQQVGKDLPKVDLPDLERFFTYAVSRHGRRIFRRDDGIEIITPETWQSRNYSVRDRYEGLVFDRDLRGKNVASRVLGVGHTLFDMALEEACDLPVNIALAEGISAPLLIVSVEDEVTGTGALVHQLTFGIIERDNEVTVLRDWELLKLLNGISSKGLAAGIEGQRLTWQAGAIVNELKQAFDAQLAFSVPSMRRPVSWSEMLILPDRSNQAR